MSSFAVLMYHEIRKSAEFQPGQASPIEVKQEYHDNLPSPLFVTWENFRVQMAYLYEEGYHTLTLPEIIGWYDHGAPLPERSVLLTFDDGYQSVAQYAYPILKQYGFRAVMFLVSGWLNTDPRPFEPQKSVCLTQEELQAMADVLEFANHTHYFHTRTSPSVSRMMEATEEELLADLQRCNDCPLVTTKDVFAYPFGLCTPVNVELLRTNGFRLAFTSEGGSNDRSTDPLLLKRNAIPYFMDETAFQRVVKNTHL